MFTLTGTILLMSMGTRHMMNNANTLKKAIEFLIFTSPVGLHGKDFSTKPTFDILLKIKEHLKHLGAFLK
jgi:hypothetical protein